MPDFEIRDKIALITGGANGIGLEYARYLIQHGLKGVTIVDINEEQGRTAVEELGPDKVHFIKTDVTKKQELKDAFKSNVQKWKGLDIVINNAGVMNDSNWEAQIALNCNAVVEGCLLALKYMGLHNGGHGGVVVNTGSILGLMEFSGCPIYTGTKHFIVGLTKSFGTPYFLNLTGVRFLTMCPGVTYTPLISEAGRFALTDFPKIAEILVQDLGSYPAQQPEDVAQGLITMLTKGENGGVWISEGGEQIYEVFLPDIKTWRKK